MRRLKNLDVMEVSLVKAGANGKKYAVVKNKQGAAMAVDGNALLDLFNKIPKDRIEAIQAVAKSAKARVRKADDLEDGVAPSDAPLAGEAVDETGLSENAQNAIKAAGRILAPYSEELDRGVMDALADALDLDTDATDEDDAAQDVIEDAVDKADEDSDADAEADASSSDDDDVTKADDDKETEGPTDNDKEAALQKAAKDFAAAKADDGAEVDNNKDEVEGDKAEDIDKADIEGDMPDFNDSDDGDKAEALSAARKAYSDVMKRKTQKSKAQKDSDGPGVGGDKDVSDEKEVPNIEKSADAIAKSALSHLKGFSKSQRDGLSQVLKSQFTRMAELEAQHKQAVAKSAKLQDEVLRREFIAKAAKDYASLGSASDLGEQMLRLHRKDPEGLKAWESVLKTANAAASAGGEANLFGELGTRMGASAGGLGDADAKIKAHVDTRVEKSSGKSREQIEAEFLNTPAGRALYSQSRAQAEKGKR